LGTLCRQPELPDALDALDLLVRHPFVLIGLGWCWAEHHRHPPATLPAVPIRALLRGGGCSAALRAYPHTQSIGQGLLGTSV